MGGAVFAVVVVLLLLGVFVYSLMLGRHRESRTPDSDWKQTNEVFKDPSTNRIMRVYVDRRGGRHYVPEPHGDQV